MTYHKMERFFQKEIESVNAEIDNLILKPLSSYNKYETVVDNLKELWIKRDQANKMLRDFKEYFNPDDLPFPEVEEHFYKE